ncbi:MAG: class I SAM-dependent methyltransferase [Candidatus Obscuribacterales bacterium]|nr:class I SAM-dependent methyltransferase [Candidatus Obscuribacterales bacterium]
MKMDEFDGKRFLATVGGDDFALAGEIEAIDLVFESMPTMPDWKVLDVGCGRGGTASYVHRKGWGQVTGIDIDQHSIDYAKERYPSLEFHTPSLFCTAGH